VSERTKTIEAIFHAAKDLAPGEERERYLSQACADDLELRREAEAFLKSAAAADSVFEVGWEGCRVSREISAVLTEKFGDTIGHYKLLEKIGEGGMGVVYMAEQEEPVRRKVALKIIKQGMDTHQVVARFEAERQALAMMDHPNIARVLDGGATETGRPYFVMELVQGVPITAYCAANQLAAGERLKLFIDVCQAIQSAHQKGIIHRDIKPSNVLVTLHNGAPHPMVIDFGVAKAIDQNLTGQTLFTNFAIMIGTPAYMSPEQAAMSKLDVDTRSDIYSLGVLLYELLTGSVPFPEERLRSVAYGEMQRIIAEEEPERPSTRRKKAATGWAAKPSSRQSPLATDLDWIVMKCLEKDRSRRYETANALAADIGRYLAGEPVVAHPPGRGYRLRRLYQRNKLRFAAAAVVLVAVIGGLVVSIRQAVRATRAEHEALAVKDFLIEQLLAANLYMETASDPNRRRLLERVAEAAGTRFANQPLIEAEVRMAVGEAFYGLDDGANAALEQFRKALAIRRRLLGATHSDTLWTIACTAQAHQELGRTSEAETVLSDALAWVEEKGDPQSVGEAEVLMTQASFLINAGRPAEAIPYLDRAMKVAERLANHKSWRFQNKLQWRIKANLMAGRTSEADALSLAGIRQAEDHFGTNHPVSAKFYGHRASVLRRTGRSPQEIIELFEKAVPVFRRSLGIDHRETLQTEFDLARALEISGELEKAFAGYRGLYERIAAKLPSDWARRALHRMGRFFEGQGRSDLYRAVRDPLCKSYETAPPANEADFSIFLQAAAAGSDWAAAADLCRQYLERFPHGHNLCRYMARALVKERRADEAKRLYNFMRQSFPDSPRRAEDMELLIEATAASLGWPAAADLCRQHFDHCPGSLWIWLIKAWVFRYARDEENYRRVVGRVLVMDPILPHEQHGPIEIAALGGCEFSAEQVQKLDSMMRALEGALPERTADLQSYGRLAIALMNLRLGRLEKCLAALEQCPDPAGPNPYKLFIQTMCLHHMGRFAEAWAVFEKAEALMDPELLSEPLGDIERFLPASQLYQQVLMHREAQALLCLE
jgi:serine/threonine protein kinase/tetratricopeptide (TPR) repeat protein